jgi:hypothetical protein
MSDRPVCESMSDETLTVYVEELAKETVKAHARLEKVCGFLSEAVCEQLQRRERVNAS